MTTYIKLLTDLQSAKAGAAQHSLEPASTHTTVHLWDLKENVGHMGPSACELRNEVEK